MESQQQQQQLSYGMPYPYQATVLSPPVVKGAMGIGVTLVALGVLSIIANAVGLGSRKEYHRRCSFSLVMVYGTVYGCVLEVTYKYSTRYDTISLINKRLLIVKALIYENTLCLRKKTCCRTFCDNFIKW